MHANRRVPSNAVLRTARIFPRECMYVFTLFLRKHAESAGLLFVLLVGVKLLPTPALGGKLGFCCRHPFGKCRQVLATIIRKKIVPWIINKLPAVDHIHAFRLCRIDCQHWQSKHDKVHVFFPVRKQSLTRQRFCLEVHTRTKLLFKTRSDL